MGNSGILELGHCSRRCLFNRGRSARNEGSRAVLGSVTVCKVFSPISRNFANVTNKFGQKPCRLFRRQYETPCPRGTACLSSRVCDRFGKKCELASRTFQCGAIPTNNGIISVSGKAMDPKFDRVPVEPSLHTQQVLSLADIHGKLIMR